jgi:hypothetical protein
MSTRNGRKGVAGTVANVATVPAATVNAGPTPNHVPGGKFAPGNNANPHGNPTYQRMAAMRRAALEAVGEKGIRRLFRALLRDAIRESDREAARMVLAYCVGKAPEIPIDPDGPDLDLLRRLGEMSALLQRHPMSLMLRLVAQIDAARAAGQLDATEDAQEGSDP